MASTILNIGNAIALAVLIAVALCGIDKRVERRGRDLPYLGYARTGFTAPSNVNFKSVTRGPFVLALDNRLMEAEKHVNVWLDHEGMKRKHNRAWNINYLLLENSFEKETYIELTPVPPKALGVWMAFEMPFLIRPTHFVGHRECKLVKILILGPQLVSLPDKPVSERGDVLYLAECTGELALFGVTDLLGDFLDGHVRADKQIFGRPEPIAA